MELIPPRALPESAHFAVLAASSSSEVERIERAAASIRARGHQVTLAANVGASHRGFLAGTDDDRLENLNQAFRSDIFDAFLFARGGYGAMRILDRLDLEPLRRNPRPLIGFSDVTALHQALAVRTGIGSFHGPMLNLDFYDGLSPNIDQWFWRMLRGEAPMTWDFDPSTVVTAGDAEGILFGGCLSITHALIATPYDYWIDDGIWFWEDVEEAPYRLDRMLTHLRLSGRLRRIRGVVIGKLKGCGSDADLRTLLSDFFGSRGIPVVLDFPFGHHGDNLLLPIGRRVRLSTDSHTLTLLQPAVSLR